MSGTNTEWGDQAQVTSVQLTATNPDGSPVVIVPALQGPSQQPVVVPGPALVEAAAALVPPGSVWHVVDAVPDPSLGAAGDLAYLATTGDVYQKQNQTTGGVTTAVWVVVGNIQGAAGSNGSKVYSVVGTPSTDLGADGDQSIDPSNGNVWLKAGGAWSLEGNFKGPAGNTPAFAQGTTTTVPAGSPAQLLLDTTNPLSIVVNAQIPKGAKGDPIGEGPFLFQTVYNATTGLPALPTPAAGNVAWLYVVTVAGAVLPAGIILPPGVTTAAVGDGILSDGTNWALAKGLLSPQAVVALTVAGRLATPGAVFYPTDHAFISAANADAEGWTDDYTLKTGGRVFRGFRFSAIRGGGELWNAAKTTMLFRVNADGSITSNMPATIPGQTATLQASQSGVIVQDPEGWSLTMFDGQMNPKLSGSSSGTTSDFSVAEEAAFDAMVLAYGQNLAATRPATTQALMGSTALNVGMNHGQSLAAAQEANPGLTTTALSPGVVMLGNDVKMVSGYVNAPATPPNALTPGLNGNLNPIKASPTNVENSSVTAGLGVHFLDCQRRGLPGSDTSFMLSEVCTAVGGKTITLLSFNGPLDTGNLQNYWAGCRAALYYEQVAATALGKPDIYLYKFRYQQGEADMAGGTPVGGVIQSATGFRDALIAIEAAVWTDLVQTYCPKQYASGIRPLFLIAQTGGPFIKDGQNLGVPMGQVLAAKAIPNALLVEGGGNHQWKVDAGGHPTVNAQRTQGNNDAIRIDRWMRGQDSSFFMLPDSSLVWSRGKTILVGYPPCQAPIKEAQPYFGLSRRALGASPTLGHSVVTSSGALTILGASVNGQAHVKISMAQSLTWPFTLANTDAANWSGNTFLEDSFTTTPPAFGANTYTTGSPMEAGELSDPDIGNPYRTNFQAKIFSLTINAPT